MDSYIRNLIRGIFHLVPVVPFYFEKYYFGVAALLLVGLTYIKTKKFQVELERLKAITPPNQDKIAESEKIKRRYEYLTFLK